MARKKKPKGTSSGEAPMESANSSPEAGGGGAYHGANTQFSTEFPLRVGRPDFSYGGITYRSYDDEIFDTNSIQMVKYPRAFNLCGFNGRTGPGQILNNSAKRFRLGDAITRLRRLWLDAYDEYVIRLDRSGTSREFPTSLNDNKAFRTYHEMYIFALGLMLHLVGRQKLMSFDASHHYDGSYAIKASRGRITSVLQDLTSLPIGTFFHQLALTWFTPFWPGPAQPVFHPYPYFDSYTQGNLFWDRAATKLGTDADATQIIGAPNIGAFNNAGNSESLSHVLGSVTAIIEHLRGNAGSANQKADMRAVRRMIGQVGVGIPHLMDWNSVPSLILGQEAFDARLANGATYFAREDGTAKAYAFPIVSSSLSFVERVFRTPPTDMDMMGFMNPYAVRWQIDDDTARGDAGVSDPSAEYVFFGNMFPAANIADLDSNVGTAYFPRDTVYTRNGAGSEVTAEDDVDADDFLLHNIQGYKHSFAWLWGWVNKADFGTVTIPGTPSVHTGAEAQLRNHINPIRIYQPLVDVQIAQLEQYSQVLGIPVV